jgi:hypothetical protein
MGNPVIRFEIDSVGDKPANDGGFTLLVASL